MSMKYLLFKRLGFILCLNTSLFFPNLYLQHHGLAFRPDLAQFVFHSTYGSLCLLTIYQIKHETILFKIKCNYIIYLYDYIYNILTKCLYTFFFRCKELLVITGVSVVLTWLMTTIKATLPFYSNIIKSPNDGNYDD